MLKLSKIIGIPVLSLQEGKIIGNVCDVLINFEHKYIENICILNNTERKKQIKPTDINFIDNKITVNNKDIIKNSDVKILIKQNQISAKEILNKNILTKKGEDIGRINDIFFNLKIGTLEAFEISDGIIQDVLFGRRLLPAIGNLMLKEEGIFISREAFEEIIESEKGLEKILLKN